MRLQCDVQVADHEHCVRKPGKGAFTQVSLGQKPGQHSDDAPIYLMLCTAQNRNGTKYLVRKNVKQIFERFTRDGKATIRFSTPPHDVIFSKASPEQLAKFIKTVKCVTMGKGGYTENLSTLVPASVKQVEKPVVTLTVSKPSQYPITFPNTLLHLTITNCSLRQVSSQLLKLTNLVSLDMSANNLQCLPDKFDNLKNLQCLLLGFNKLTNFPVILCNNPLLEVLDLRHNQIHGLSPDIVKMQKLQTLHLEENEISSLPETIGLLPQLREIFLSQNKLKFLPGTFLLRRYSSADFCQNPFVDSLPLGHEGNLSFGVPTLAEWAARTITAHRIHFTDEDLDAHSIAYLKTAHHCVCGRPCFESSVSHVERRRFPSTTNVQEDVSFLLHYCSKSCFPKSRLPSAPP